MIRVVYDYKSKKFRDRIRAIRFAYEMARLGYEVTLQGVRICQ